jgi:hypothetical protein
MEAAAREPFAAVLALPFIVFMASLRGPKIRSDALAALAKRSRKLPAPA